MTNLNTNKTLMKIVEYKNSSKVTVEFQDQYKHKTETTYQSFIRGVLTNPYDRTVYGVGYKGIGIHLSFLENTHIHYRKYTVWENMLCRCYYEKERQKHLAYSDCTVCDEWHNYQNFAKWYDENYYEIETGRIHIDKDILVKGNKIYSPDTCIFIPQRINMVFMKKNRAIDADLPTGIRRCYGGYMAEYNTKYLGVHNELDSAIKVYMIEKRKHIKKLAEEYKSLIPEKAYIALLRW